MTEGAAGQNDFVPKYLLERGIISETMADNAAVRQKKETGERFCTALVLGGSLLGGDLMRSLSMADTEDFIEVDGHFLQPRLMHVIPESMAFDAKFLPFHQAQDVLFGAVPMPWNRSCDLARIEGQVKLHVEPVSVEEVDVPGVLMKCLHLLRARSLQERLIGQALVERGLLTPDQLKRGLLHQEQKGGRIGQALVHLGFITEAHLYRILSERFRMPFLDLPQLIEMLNPVTAKMVTHSFAEHNLVLPFTHGGETVKVACSSVCDPNVLETLKGVSGCRKVEPFLVPQNGLKAVIHSVYTGSPLIGGGGPAAPDAAEHAPSSGVLDLTTEVTVEDVADAQQLDQEVFTDPEVPKIINYMLYQAVKKSTSDIHIEQYENRADVKFRIDGKLRKLPNIPVNAQNVVRVISKLKIDAGLDIAERRKPQDGSFRKRFGEKLIVDFRLAIQPTLFGENAVIRILDRTAPLPSLAQLGMPDDMYRKYLRAIGNPQGMIIFTGPTGSGKTTTLYCTLAVLRQQNLKIITAEDPVE